MKKFLERMHHETCILAEALLNVRQKSNFA